MSITLEAQSPALARLTPRERVTLREVTMTRAYAVGEMIFHEGESSPGLWFVEHGRVRLFKTAPDGHELTVCIVRAGDPFCLGTCPLFDGDLNPVSAQALEPVTLKMLDKRAIIAQLNGDVAVGISFGKMLADRYRHFTRLTSALALHCIRVRVADALLSQAGQRGEHTTRGIEMDLDLTQELLASCLGTDRAVVARTLHQFKREGILESRGKHITLYDLAALERMSRV